MGGQCIDPIMDQCNIVFDPDQNLLSFLWTNIPFSEPIILARPKRQFPNSVFGRDLNWKLCFGGRSASRRTSTCVRSWENPLPHMTHILRCNPQKPMGLVGNANLSAPIVITHLLRQPRAFSSQTFDGNQVRTQAC